MRKKIEFLLSEYYRYYRIIIGYPHILSELLGDMCNEVSEHTNCCALQQIYFSYMCPLLGIKEGAIGENADLSCHQGRLKGNQLIRAGKIKIPTMMNIDSSLSIKLAIIATFTPKVVEKPKLLQSVVSVLINNNTSTDQFVNDFFKIYNDPFDDNKSNCFSCETEFGIAIVQIFSVCKVDDGKPIFYLADTEQLKNYLENKIKRYKKNINVYNKYQECSI